MSGRQIISLVGQQQDLEQFQKRHWQGSFADYLDIVRKRPEVTRNAFERIYDMIIEAGTESYQEGREQRTHFQVGHHPHCGALYCSWLGIQYCQSST